MSNGPQKTPEPGIQEQPTVEVGTTALTADETTLQDARQSPYAELEKAEGALNAKGARYSVDLKSLRGLYLALQSESDVNVSTGAGLARAVEQIHDYIRDPEGAQASVTGFLNVYLRLEHPSFTKALDMAGAGGMPDYATERGWEGLDTYSSTGSGGRRKAFLAKD